MPPFRSSPVLGANENGPNRKSRPFTLAFCMFRLAYARLATLSSRSGGALHTDDKACELGCIVCVFNRWACDAGSMSRALLAAPPGVTLAFEIRLARAESPDCG